MFYYGIVIGNDDIFEIEAKKINVGKDRFIKSKYEKYITPLDPYFVGRKIPKHHGNINSYIVDELIYKENIFGLRGADSILRIIKIKENKIFIGCYKSPSECQLIPFSVLNNELIDETKRNEINEKLCEYSYGKFIPSFWFNMDRINRNEHTNYTSDQKIKL